MSQEQNIYSGLDDTARKYITIREVRIIINLARPLRLLLRTYLSRWRSGIVAQKNGIVKKAQRYDKVSTELGVYVRVINLILRPIEDLNKQIPWGRISEDSPEMAELFNQMIRAIPASIPSSLMTVEVRKFLSGIRTYGELKDKMKEITYEAQRVTALSSYANEQNKKIDKQVERIDAYINLLTLAM